MIMFGISDAKVAGGAVVAPPQEDVRKERVKERKKNEENLRMFDAVCNVSNLYYLTACFSSSKDDIQAIVFINSSSDALFSRKARTAGPTGSSPAAPPGTSA